MRKEEGSKVEGKVEMEEIEEKQNYSKQQRRKKHNERMKKDGNTEEGKIVKS